jgi:hypothetical protein
VSWSLDHEFVWRSHAPSRVRFFAWLLFKARIQSQIFLIHEWILTATKAVCPIYGGKEEMASHIMFGCAFAVHF